MAKLVDGGSAPLAAGGTDALRVDPNAPSSKPESHGHRNGPIHGTPRLVPARPAQDDRGTPGRGPGDGSGIAVRRGHRPLQQDPNPGADPSDPDRDGPGPPGLGERSAGPLGRE